MGNWFYVIRKAKSDELEKLIKKLTAVFDGFLIGSTVLLESKISEFKRITNNLSKDGVNKPLIADLKLTYNEKEEINSTMQILYDNSLNGITIWGLLDREIISYYTKFSKDFEVYAYLGKTDVPYSIIEKIPELKEAGCDGIILSFNFISEINKIKEKIKTATQLYLCADGDENILIPLNC